MQHWGAEFVSCSVLSGSIRHFLYHYFIVCGREQPLVPTCFEVCLGLPLPFYFSFLTFGCSHFLSVTFSFPFGCVVRSIPWSSLDPSSSVNVDERSQTDNLLADIDLTHITVAHNRNGIASPADKHLLAAWNRPIKSYCHQLAKLEFNHEMVA